MKTPRIIKIKNEMTLVFSLFTFLSNHHSHFEDDSRSESSFVCARSMTVKKKSEHDSWLILFVLNQVSVSTIMYNPGEWGKIWRGLKRLWIRTFRMMAILITGFNVKPKNSNCWPSIMTSKISVIESVRRRSLEERKCYSMGFSGMWQSRWNGTSLNM